MMDDFTTINHRFEDEIDIVPIADVHFGAIEHATREWEDFLLALKGKPNTYIVLVGDLINNGVRSAVGNPFQQTHSPSEQKEIMTEYLKPIADRILCCVSGNHEARTAKETDQQLCYDIMARLAIEDRYREYAAFMKVGIGTRQAQKHKAANAVYTICVTHGSVGGRLTGGTINRAEDFAVMVEGLNALVVGHSHKGAVTRPRTLVFDARNDRVTWQDRVIVSAESWMNYGGYALGKMLRPAEIGHPQIMRLRRSKDFKRIEVTW